MSTADFAHPARSGRARSAVAWTAGLLDAPALLTVALLALLTYAAFDHAAVSVAAQARLDVALAAIAALAAAAGLWRSSLRFAAPPAAMAGMGLLGAFGLWNGVTLIWSIEPDATWLELNRVLAYALMLCLGIAAGASSRQALQRVSIGFVAVAQAVAIYALAQKLLPGLHVAGVFDLNQTGSLPRLQEPLGYWNALALFLVLSVPSALVLTASRELAARWRLLALGALTLTLLTIGLTLSRGGLLAVVVAAVVIVAARGAGLRSLMWLALAVLAAAPSFVFGLASHALSASDVPLGRREGAGAILFAILVISLAAQFVLARRLQKVERRMPLAQTRQRAARWALIALVAAVVVAGVIALSASGRGLGGSISHAWRSFTATHSTSVYDPHRLLSTDSENRWVWWKEAAGAFTDRPLQGWGAGAFPVLHLLYRRDTLSVKQPHNVPLQWLAETGLVGAALALAAFLLLLVAATRSIRRRAAGPDRLAASALLAAVISYVVHFVFDWDWDIPAVTLPVMLFLGLLIARAPDSRNELVPGAELVPWRPGYGTRLLLVLLCTGGLGAFALAAALPSVAGSEASSAITAASTGATGDLHRAARSAALASGLDPLSDAGPAAQATLALRRGDTAAGRRYLLEAIRREPSNPQAWNNLAYLEIAQGNLRDAIRAAARARALDPLGAATSGRLAQISVLLALRQTPPQDSATAAALR